MPIKAKNWAGNYEYSTTNIQYPKTIEEAQTIVRNHQKVRALGTRHSFNGIADSTDTIISLEQFAPSIQIDHDRATVSISANLRYGDVCQHLRSSPLALHNLGSLPHISVAGATATGTHGSGDGNQNLAAVVSGLEVINAAGELISFSREKDSVFFDALAVNLGGLGVVVGITLDLVPTFEISQWVYERLPFTQLDAHFDEIMASSYSVSLFTNWQGEFINQVWLKQDPKRDHLVDQPHFFGAIAADKPLHPIAEMPANACTQQLGVVGAWHERLPHFRFDAVPSAGHELQSEYFVARRHAIEAIHALRGLQAQLTPHLLVSEIRTVAADNLWMSPCYHQDSVAFHFTWKPDWSAVSQILPFIESRLAPFGARPHWGKLFTMPPPHLDSLYEKLPQFRELLLHYDPQGKFRNAFLEQIIG